jgi:hypothetical protein
MNLPLGERQVKLWNELTQDEKDGFTMDGTVERGDWWRDESVDEFTVWDKNDVSQYIQDAKDRKMLYYDRTDGYLYESLDEYKIEGESVAILGSQKPWYEAIVLTYGGKPTTIEYNKIKTNDERLITLTLDEYMNNPTEFDFVISISSFEHSGLGRYGDTINPDGDLEAMENVGKNILKKDGLFFLSVPVGVDKCWFNAHRIYGQIRWPKLIEGFEVVGTFGLGNSDFVKDTNKGVHQPVVVLKNKWK